MDVTWVLVFPVTDRSKFVKMESEEEEAAFL
jgi:hypothetical protein